MVPPDQVSTILATTLTVVTGSLGLGNSDPATTTRATTVLSRILQNVELSSSSSQSFITSVVEGLGHILLQRLVPGATHAFLFSIV